jgi:DNA invertase Pin-like site-specific DNA recombinase
VDNRAADPDGAGRAGRVRAPPDRTGEGRKRAKAHGVLFGRPRKLTPHQRREVIACRDAGKETLMDIARSYNVSHLTISRL